MRTICPFPRLSMALASTWLILAGFSPAQVAAGLLFALAIPLTIAPLLDVLPTVRSVSAAMMLVARVLWDIVVANVVVARLVLGRVKRLRPAFVAIPVSVTDPAAISLFMSMISITPGSVPIALSPDSRWMLVHVLDLEDEAAFIAMVKDRYERPLMEILEC
jgi:multicomponent K+:H+ antiporter subunit E